MIDNDKEWISFSLPRTLPFSTKSGQSKYLFCFLYFWPCFLCRDSWWDREKELQACIVRFHKLLAAAWHHSPYGVAFWKRIKAQDGPQRLRSSFKVVWFAKGKTLLRMNEIWCSLSLDKCELFKWQLPQRASQRFEA